jgi:hypothetical protein
MGEEDNEYRMGELRGDVNAIKNRLEEIKAMIDSTHSTHSEGYDALEKRIRSLERYRSWFLGVCGAAAALAGVAAAAARLANAGLLS